MRPVADLVICALVSTVALAACGDPPTSEPSFEDPVPLEARSRALREAVARDEPEAIQTHWRALWRDHDGHMLSEDGRPVAPDIAALWLRDALLARLDALHREGPPADGGLRMRIAADANRHVHVDEQETFQQARRWFGLQNVRDLSLGAPVPERPHLLVVVDAFAIEEELLWRVLAAWQEKHGLPVQIVHVDRGFLRQGRRRVPVEEAEVRRAHFRTLAEERGFTVVAAGLQEELGAIVGLDGAQNALFAVDGAGRIVARQRARMLTPRALESAVERLVTR